MKNNQKSYHQNEKLLQEIGSLTEKAEDLKKEGTSLRVENKELLSQYDALKS